MNKITTIKFIQIFQPSVPWPFTDWRRFRNRIKLNFGELRSSFWWSGNSWSNPGAQKWANHESPRTLQFSCEVIQTSFQPFWIGIQTKIFSVSCLRDSNIIRMTQEKSGTRLSDLSGISITTWTFIVNIRESSNLLKRINPSRITFRCVLAPRVLVKIEEKTSGVRWNIEINLITFHRTSRRRGEWEVSVFVFVGYCRWMKLFKG